MDSTQSTALAKCKFRIAGGIMTEELESSTDGDVELRSLLRFDKNVCSGCQAVRMNFRIACRTTGYPAAAYAFHQCWTRLRKESP